MNSTVKVILVWFLILVAAVAVYSFVERAGESRTQRLDLTDFLAKVDQGQVAEVEITGSQLKGRLVGNDEPFTSTIPEGDAPIFDRLTREGVQVTILPEQRNAWIGSVPTVLVITGLLLWIAISLVVLVLLVDLSRFVKRRLSRSGGNPSAA